MTNHLNNSIYFLFISFFFFSSPGFSKVETDSIKIDRFERHIKSLDYISRKTSDKKQYLNLAKSYCDSILLLDSNNAFAKKFNDKIELTLTANEFNMNHRVQLFELFNGFPEYMAFADDPIEYAYDDAIASLLQSKEIDYQKGPIGDARFPSIIVRENCDDEMFEIANQIIIQNSSHYIIPLHQLESILGVDNASNLINGEVNKEYLELILKDLNAETIGVFTLNDLDVIENSIWYVQSSFYAFKLNSGFTQTIFTRGFNHDKRNTNIALIFLSLLGSLVLISFFSFLDQRKKIMRTIADEILVTEKIKKSVELFVNKIGRVFTYSVIPLVFSFLMIYAVSNLIPEPESDIREATSRIWLLTLTLGMSLFPTLVNLIIVNRLDFDGFHTDKGYRLFFNTSLYTTYFPIFVFYIIKFETFPVFEHIQLIIVTFAIAWLLSRSYYQFTSITIHKNLKIQAGIGLIFGIISLVALNFFILTNLSYTSLTYGFLIALVFSIIHSLIDKKIKQINSEKEKQSSEQSLIKSDIYLNEVFDPVKNIYEKIKLGMKNDDLDIMILSAPMGIGKTASLLKARVLFKENEEWDTYYGDCDEIQDEGAISFEPFLEAFGEELNISQFSNRGEQIDRLKDSAIAAGSAVGVNTDILTDYERDNQKSMTETCIEIIDRLEAKGKKLVFFLEDLHFIDPETYSFLKHFITIINNNPFLRKSICIVLSLRNGQNEEYRGINEETLRKDLAEINEDEDSPVIPETLYEYKDVNLVDFVKNLSNQDNSFKIQSYTMNQINELFNNKLKENKDKFVLTPLYIKKTIEGWIDDDTLKFSPDGYLLTRRLSEYDLPNSDEADKYYHSIFESYDEKWQRLLESAAIIGNRFDAEILAKVWGYEFLDILSFLEKAVRDELLEDLSAEDNMYKFTDKRIITAIKSYFKTHKNKKEQFILEDKNGKEVEESKIKEFEKKFDLNRNDSQFKKLLSNEGFNLILKPEGDKQIVIEYNKRYVALQENIIKNPDNYSTEDILKVSRRLTSLIASKDYKVKLEKLVINVLLRLIIKNEFNKIRAYADFLKSKNLDGMSFLIKILSYVSNSEETDHEFASKEISKIHNLNIEDDNPLYFVPQNDFQYFLKLLCCLYYKPIRITKKELDFVIRFIDEMKLSNDIHFQIMILIINNSENRAARFKQYDELLLKLDGAENFSYYFDKINLEKLIEKTNYLNLKYNNTWSTVYKEPNINDLENEYLTMNDKYLKLNDMDLKFGFVRSNLNFLDQVAEREEQAIKYFNDTIEIFENSNYDPRYQIRLKMFILRGYTGRKYLSSNKEKYLKYYEEINSYFKKRITSNTWNNSVNEFYKLKIENNVRIKNYEEALKICQLRIKNISEKVGENNRPYIGACKLYANTLFKSKNFKKALHWYGNAVSIQEKLIGEKDDSSTLGPAYNNLVYYYMEAEPKNHKKIKEYAKKALDLSGKESIDYYNRLDTYAEALEFIGEYEESYSLFQKALSMLKKSKIDDKKENVLLNNLKSSLVLFNYNKSEALPKIKTALADVKKEKIDRYEDLQIKANKILKDHKK